MWPSGEVLPLNNNLSKIGFGGGCHWCTEGVFQSLQGIIKVEQGWISSFELNDTLSEGVIVYFDPQKISLKVLVEIHLHTHSSTSSHSMRSKYRSAVYAFSDQQQKEVELYLQEIQPDFELKIITQSLKFNSFKPNTESFINYLYKNPEKQFCKRYIHPKIQFLLTHYGKNVDQSKTAFLTNSFEKK